MTRPMSKVVEALDLKALRRASKKILGGSTFNADERLEIAEQVIRTYQRFSAIQAPSDAEPVANEPIDLAAFRKMANEFGRLSDSDMGDYMRLQLALRHYLNNRPPRLSSPSAAIEDAARVLELIASHAGKTLISVEHGQPYSIGANAAFEQMAATASDALSAIRALTPRTT